MCGCIHTNSYNGAFADGKRGIGVFCGGLAHRPLMMALGRTEDEEWR